MAKEAVVGGADIERIPGRAGAARDPNAIREQFLRDRRNTVIRHLSIVWFFRVGLLVAFLWAWQYAADQKMVNEFFFSKPSVVWSFLTKFFEDGEIYIHFLFTLQATVLGFSLGVVTGIPFGLMLARFPLLEQILSPYLAALNALPRVALAPMFILWFGIGIASKVVLVFSLVFFIVLINTRAGVNAADEELLRMSTVMGATQRQRFLKVILPGAVPSIFAGLRLGIVYSLLGTVVSEMVAAPAGLGQQISLFAGTYRTGGVLAILLLLSLTGVALNGLALLVERRLLRWQR